VVKSAVFGRVYEKSTFLPLKGAEVTVNNIIVATSDENGVFTFATDDNNPVSIKVYCDGYFPYTVVADVKSDEITTAVRTVTVAMMKEVKAISVDPSQENFVQLPVLNSAPAAVVNFPANVLPDDLTSMHAVNYVSPAASSVAALYLHPWGTKLKEPVEVAFVDNLPADVSYDGAQVEDEGQTTKASSTKAEPIAVTYDEMSNQYKFMISQFGNYVLNAKVVENIGAIVLDNSPYQTIAVDNACSQNSVYEWEQTAKTVSGFEVKTNVAAEVKNKFAGIDDAGAKAIETEVMRMVNAYFNAPIGKVERDVTSGIVKINPGTINVYNSYLYTRTITLAFNLIYKGSKVELPIESVEYLGVKSTNTAVSCDDHSGGGSHSGGGTN
ncbi:MAG: hypothetical protein ACRDCN_05595, partial [Tannerellaceae bacterium]